MLDSLELRGVNSWESSIENSRWKAGDAAASKHRWAKNVMLPVIRVTSVWTGRVHKLFMFSSYVLAAKHTSGGTGFGGQNGACQVKSSQILIMWSVKRIIQILIKFNVEKDQSRPFYGIINFITHF